MVVGIKDGIKLVGISIIAFCAVLVCTLFLNYYVDLLRIKGQVLGQATFFYDAQVMTAKVICLVSGGCLFITSCVMLVFYIKHYIDTHKKELGILKALGYSPLQVAKHFWVFGISVLCGGILGFGCAFSLMPNFYDAQNKDRILSELTINFHPALFLYLVVLPTFAFFVLAVFYACIKLKMPALLLLKENMNTRYKICKCNEENEGLFLSDLKKNTLKTKKIQVFFIIFSSFCFAAMTQMSASMKDLSSFMIGVMIMIIGLVLACTTLFIAITTVIKGNMKTIAIMQVFGYFEKECSRAILGGYRLFSYIGFAIGTVYQYLLLKIMVNVVFANVDGVPEYNFDFLSMFISLSVFIIFYEGIILLYSKQIKNISIKKIMLE